jgi:hypothetical protein
LTPEDATIRAVAFLAYLLHNLIHGPSIQLIVSEDSQVHAILLGVSFHRLQTVVTVALDALIDGKQYEVETIVISLVQRLQHRG